MSGSFFICLHKLKFNVISKEKKLIADLSGKTAIITGGGQGLGLGISTKIAGQGANIIVTDLDDRNKSTVEESYEHIGFIVDALKGEVTE